MRKWFAISLLALLAAACGEKPEGSIAEPAVKLTVREEGHTAATISVESIFCDEVFVMAGPPDATPSAEVIAEGGILALEGQAVLTGLTPGSRYTAYGVGRKDDTYSKVARVNFSTSAESGAWQGLRQH